CVSIIVVYCCLLFFFFFFQAEDGIRDRNVTGVQTCALPICLDHEVARPAGGLSALAPCDLVIEAAPERLELKRELFQQLSKVCQIGRASCRERVEVSVGGGSLREKERRCGAA